MPERIQVRCKGNATLDNKKTTSAQGKPLSTASGTILNEAIRGSSRLSRYSAGRSNVSSSSARLLPTLRMTLALMAATHSRIATFSSASEKKR